MRAAGRARGAWVAARAGGGPRGVWGPGEGWESSVPPRQSPALSLSRALAAVRGPCSAGKRLREKGGLACPASGAASRKPAWARRASLTGLRQNRWLPPVKAGRCVLRSFVHPVLGFSIPSCEEFRSRENSECACFCRICSQPSFANHNEEPRQKEWGCQAVGQHLQPKKQPGASGSRTRGKPGAAQPASSRDRSRRFLQPGSGED